MIYPSLWRLVTPAHQEVLLNGLLDRWSVSHVIHKDIASMCHPYM